MTHVTCRLTAKNRDQLRNPTLGNLVWATFTFYLRFTIKPLCLAVTLSLFNKFHLEITRCENKYFTSVGGVAGCITRCIYCSWKRLGKYIILKKLRWFVSVLKLLYCDPLELVIKRDIIYSTYIHFESKTAIL